MSTDKPPSCRHAAGTLEHRSSADEFRASRTYRHNAVVRRLHTAFRWRFDDLVAVFRLGGLEVSSSKVRGWVAPPGSFRRPDPKSKRPEERERKDKPMTEEQWRAFWRGLAAWLEQATTHPIERVSEALALRPADLAEIARLGNAAGERERTLDAFFAGLEIWLHEHTALDPDP